jgi:tetratricopeptide (TPR) repeat protein
MPRRLRRCLARAEARAPRSYVALALALVLNACATRGPAPAPLAPPPAAPLPEKTSIDAPGAFSLSRLAEGAKLLDNLGKTARVVSTSSPEAQAFFNQGLAFAYGFNHDEAARSFARAAQRDPSCALCLWGAAYTLGPNYNIPLLPDRAQAAWEAITRAQALVDKATPPERALISALAKRYKGPEYLDPVAMQPFNEAYANAMREVAQSFPDDLDIQVLFADAAMVVRPWQLWSLDGTPAPGTEEILTVLEAVLAKAPEHVGANHLYIHAVEASKKPERALASAERLGALVPGAGHLVHMPAHIFQRVGRYADASKANQAAVVSDQQYIASLPPPGYYPFYLAHNYGFLAYSAAMEGRSAEALAAARKSRATMPMDIVCGMPGMDFFLSEPLLVMVRFGKWQEILAEPAPEPRHAVLTGLYHHAQAMALAATDRPAEALARVVEIRKIQATLPADMLAGYSPAKTLLELSAKVVEARLAESTEKEKAVALWQEAVKLEDGLAYAEPADWFYPTRHYLGALLLELGRAKEAEASYREDLAKNPENGWALYGLWQALLEQKQKAPAKEAEARFRKAFAASDLTLTRSAF